jgi:hypothetical protein
MKQTILILSISLMFMGCSPETFTSIDGKEIELITLLGSDVFSVQNTHTTTGFETIGGTDSDIWVVYSKEMDVTLVSKKKTNKIVIVEKGKKPM